jgi:hypothetical protein
MRPTHFGVYQLTEHGREIRVGRPDLAQQPLVVRRRPESETVGIGVRRKLSRGAEDRLVDDHTAFAGVLLVQSRKDLPEL